MNGETKCSDDNSANVQGSRTKLLRRIYVFGGEIAYNTSSAANYNRRNTIILL